MVLKRRRKKLPVPERQPLLRPTQPNTVWSMDFVFDELASGRRVKTLTIVDDCSKEAVHIAVDTAIPAPCVTRVLDQIKAERGLSKVIRTENASKATFRRSHNGPDFAGRTMQQYAAKNSLELRLIQPGKPVQNAFIESFNSRFRDECLSQHGFASLSHMRSVIDNWREDDNHHRPHSALGYVPPAVSAAMCRQRLRQRTKSCITHCDVNPWALDRSATKTGGSAVGLLVGRAVRGEEPARRSA